MFLITEVFVMLGGIQPILSGIASLGVLIPPLAAACVVSLLAAMGSSRT